MTDPLRSQLEDLISWWPILDDVADSLLGVTGHGLTLDGIRSGGGDSATELAVLQLEQIADLTRTLTALARKTGWRDYGRDGRPATYIHAHLPWARKNLAAAELDPIIADLHKTVARLTGHAPRPTNHTCPACGQTQLTLTDTGDLHCAECDETRTPQETAALTTWRITHSDEHAPLPLVAKHLGIKPSRIRQWITRGHITRTPEGHIPINTARQLRDE